MEVALSSTCFSKELSMLSCKLSCCRSSRSGFNRSPSHSPWSRIRASLTNSSTAPLVGGNVSADFCGHSIRVPSLRPRIPGRGGKRAVVTMVVPFLRGSAWEQPPPDLASYLFKNRIVYLGMPLVPAVTELMLAEFLYLQYDDPNKPVYLYINSTGTTKGGKKLGYETEALAIYDVMRYSRLPIFTLCVGNAWGEAALLLAAGSKGNRSALPSSTIMIKQPIARVQGQATDVNLARIEMNKIQSDLVKLYARHMGKTREQIEQDLRRPKYFSPKEAVEYGIIDKVLQTEKGKESHSVIAELKGAELI
ncbi:hypothetical protein HPP92_012551 [Vanilla planifolia]|uniref:ATP-dependent Clp protease proteolytic subunit n=1 Tax=Vanilla planifolia TaxID=51239 RepID=A0A835UXM9_VANPL|nr:hypothetical protein HPP92_012964 [Vanilla planifolia]KAG0477832.1 hypothetical protein HPP92_012551 [Vanilla planifolia]